MGDQLPELEADMLFSGGERAIPFTTVLCRHPRHLMDTANVEDRPEGPLLLVFVRKSGGERLNRRAVGLADFQIIPGLVIIRSNRYRMPWAIVLLAHCPTAALIDCAASPTWPATTAPSLT